jgi:hypothetical protein
VGGGEEVCDTDEGATVVDTDGGATVEELVGWLASAFPHIPTSAARVREILGAARSEERLQGGPDAAVAWAAGFRLPDEALAQDAALWERCGGVFENMVRDKLAALADTRLSEERVRQHVPVDDPDFERMLALARGQELYTAEGFADRTFDTRPALGRRFVAAAPAVERMFYETYWRHGLAILLSAEHVKAMGPFSLCIAGWAPKAGKDCGRPITNGSGRRGMRPSEYLNGPLAKEAAIAAWGRIELPTIGDAARMIVEHAARRGLLRSDLVLWKYDLQRAYTLVSYSASAARRVGVELTAGRFMFFLAGVFGLTGMPMAFDVVTRVIQRALRSAGLCMLQYVDDGLGVSAEAEVASHQAQANAYCRGLLGPEAMAAEKEERGKALVFIGYEIDLVSDRVSISPRNLRRSLYAFLAVDLGDGARVPCRVLLRLGSLGGRFAQMCPVLNPFVTALYRPTVGRVCMLSSVTLDDEVKAVIRMFRCILVLQHFHGVEFSRTLDSFVKKEHTWAVEFDASLTGVGVIGFRVEGGREVCGFYTFVDLRPLGFCDDSSFQNVAEFIGLLVAQLALRHVGAAGEPTLVRGDSVTALRWGERGRSKGSLATRAALLWGLCVVRRVVNVVGFIHIPGKSNQLTDGVSRGKSWEQVLALDRDLSAPPRLRPDATHVELDCTELLQLCDPKKPLNTDGALAELFSRALSLV